MDGRYEDFVLRSLLQARLTDGSKDWIFSVRVSLSLGEEESGDWLFWKVIVMKGKIWFFSLVEVYGQFGAE